MTRANGLRDTICDWQESTPSKDERDNISRKVLSLHVALVGFYVASRSRRVSGCPLLPEAPHDIDNCPQPAWKLVHA